jgi:adenine-specific DNA-methyltransferase
MKVTQFMRYIGCKNNLLSCIEEITFKNGSQTGVFCDPFAGTHSVAAHFKKLGFQIISNDLLFLAYVFGRALIKNNRKPTFDGLAEKVMQNGQRIHGLNCRMQNERGARGAGLEGTGTSPNQSTPYLVPASFCTPITEGNAFGYSELRTGRTPHSELKSRQPPGLFDQVDPYLKVLGYLNHLDGVTDGFIFNAYCPCGDNEYNRQYISDRNGQKVDAVRQRIEAWRQEGAITEDEYYILLLSLLEAVSRVTNISGVYGAYLKKWDARTYKELTLEPILPIPSDKEHAVYQEDANKLIERIECDILYIDPPYNTRQYITNYHLLETIARYDNPEVYGKTGLRPYSNAEKSAYCSKEACLDAFADLIQKAKAKHIIVSYNSEGVMTKEAILDVLRQKGAHPQLYPIDYRRFKSNSNGESKNKKKVQEYLFYVRTTYKNAKWETRPAQPAQRLNG